VESKLGRFAETKVLRIDRLNLFLTGIPVECGGHQVVVNFRVSRERGQDRYSVEWTVTAIDSHELDADELLTRTESGLSYADVQRLFCVYFDPLAFNRVVVQLVLNREDSRYLAISWSKMPHGLQVRFVRMPRYFVENHEWSLFSRMTDENALEYVMEASLALHPSTFGSRRLFEMRERAQPHCDPLLRELLRQAGVLG
jgi:hypothetical protein